MGQVREEINMAEVSLDNTMQAIQEFFQGFQQAARDEILGLGCQLSRRLRPDFSPKSISPSF